MGIYERIQGYVKSKYGYSVKTCWIAHVKEMCGLKPRVASNRLNRDHRCNPCPTEKVESIREALRHLGMI